MSDSHRTSALAILRSGRLTMLHVLSAGDAVHQVVARVQSSRTGGPRYAVDLLDGRWACTCSAWTQANRCSHLLAVQMVTDHSGGDS